MNRYGKAGSRDKNDVCRVFRCQNCEGHGLRTFVGRVEGWYWEISTGVKRLVAL
jgi:hypothetical protein